MRETRSVVMTILSIISFFVVLGIAIKFLGLALIVGFKFLLPLALVILLIQGISKKTKNA